jgi:hypothetical protein
MSTGSPEGAWTVGHTTNFGANPQVWLVDSGATSHVTWDRGLFTSFLTIEPPIPVTIANGESIPCCGVGTVKLHQENRQVPGIITIQNVRYMPDLNTNLLSVSKLEGRGIYVASRPGFLDLIRNGKTLATVQRNGGLYVLKLGSGNHHETAFAADDKAITWDILCARLAHVGGHFITKIANVTEGSTQVLVWPKDQERPAVGVSDQSRSGLLAKNHQCLLRIHLDTYTSIDRAHIPW